MGHLFLQRTPKAGWFVFRLDIQKERGSSVLAARPTHRGPCNCLISQRWTTPKPTRYVYRYSTRVPYYIHPNGRSLLLCCLTNHSNLQGFYASSTKRQDTPFRIYVLPPSDDTLAVLRPTGFGQLNAAKLRNKSERKKNGEFCFKHIAATWERRSGHKILTGGTEWQMGMFVRKNYRIGHRGWRKVKWGILSSTAKKAFLWQDESFLMAWRKLSYAGLDFWGFGETETNVRIFLKGCCSVELPLIWQQ